jgi:uncharacterized protein DUF6636
VRGTLRHMRRSIVVLALTALLCAAVPAIARDVVFRTPSKKIACRVYDPANQGPEIRCDLFFLNDRAVRMTRRGKARLIHVTDTVGDPKAPVLAYGRTRRIGPFTCTSRTTGLSCHNRAGHGFTVSREHQSVH